MYLNDGLIRDFDSDFASAHLHGFVKNFAFISMHCASDLGRDVPERDGTSGCAAPPLAKDAKGRLHTSASLMTGSMAAISPSLFLVRE